MLGQSVIHFKVCADPLSNCMAEEKMISYKKTDEVVEFNKKSEIPFATSAPYSSKDDDSSATTSGIAKKIMIANNARTPRDSLNEPLNYVNRPINNIPTFTSEISNWPGDYNFQVNVPFANDIEQRIYKQEFNMLFVKINATCPLHFIMNKKITSRLYIRAMAVYFLPSCNDFVKRIFIHSVRDNSLEKDHLLRCEHPSAIYQISEDKQLRSVVIPFENPPCTIYNFKFMCFTSCINGPNRRPIKLIFQLELGSLKILGRRVFNLKVCANPLRHSMTLRERVYYQKTDDDEVVEFNKKSGSPFAICDPHSSKDNNSSAATIIEKYCRKEYNFRNLIVVNVEIANKSIDNIHPFTSDARIFDWPGEYDFKVFIPCGKLYDNQQWIYKQEINKLYVKRYGKCPLNFIINTKITSSCYIRAMMVSFSPSCGDMEFARKYIISHGKKGYLDQCKHPYAIYQIEKQICSILIPFEDTSSITYSLRFRSFQSCINGPSEKSVILIFQLYSESRKVLGQCAFNVMIIANPLDSCIGDKKNKRQKTDSEVN